MDAAETPFMVDPSYVLRQTQERLLLEVKDHVLTKAGFEQVTEMHNQKVMQIQALEGQVAQLREEIGSHEKFAVDQQMKIDGYELAAKDMGFETFDAFMDEVGRSLHGPNHVRSHRVIETLVTSEDEPEE